jgi:hypothetical protein
VPQKKKKKKLYELQRHNSAITRSAESLPHSNIHHHDEELKLQREREKERKTLSTQNSQSRVSYLGTTDISDQIIICQGGREVVLCMSNIREHFLP